ncbi:MAG TPA: pentapeptide repeat-containing protein [Pirellulales bacterium]|nr:pentapeptide repeat-containing protein [Pirellulales bacterium]
MVEPARAAVRPRVVSPETGDSVLLEDEVSEWLKGPSETLKIVGGTGSGKTAALRHLLAVFGPLEGVQWLDDVGFPDLVTFRRTIYTTATPWNPSDGFSLRLAAWTGDELLEYCLNRHRERCSSILERCRTMTDTDRLEGIPELWTAVLDALAADDGAVDWRKIFTDRVAAMLPQELLRPARQYCHGVVASYATQRINAAKVLSKAGWPPHRQRLLRHRAVQLLMAAANVVDALEQQSHLFFFSEKWPRELLGETTRALPSSAAACEQLASVFAGNVGEYQAIAATLLHALGRGWQPPTRTRARLTGAVFAGAAWPQIDLRHATLDEVDFSGADLTAAQLDSVRALGTDFGRALLRKACLRKAKLYNARFASADLEDAVAIRSWCSRADFRRANLRRADFSHAKLHRANFTGACLVDAVLVGACLTCAIFANADLTRADLQRALLRRVRLAEATLAGARLAGATLVEADLEGMYFPDADFAHANLKRAYLTGSVMPRANFRGARLCEAGLADVSWEEADLRGADFTNCSFHLGSSRSGLVGSPIACEGSRTGFYTDDFLDQGFKSPEEIRKANLRGADLRGAAVHKTDFYLVDLRGARYTPDQADHFRRCGAIA